MTVDHIAPSERPLLIEATGLTKRYAGTTALDGVDFDLRAGEVHCLVGENGAGKSTLIKILTGAVRQEEGAIKIRGDDASGLNLRERRDRGVSVIYQDLNLVPHLTVAENIYLGHELRTSRGTLDTRGMERGAQEVIDSFGVAFSASSRVDRLGISLQQLTATARALSLNGIILIMDEPSAVLVGEELEVLFSVVKRLKERGLGIIYISHRLEEIFEIGDRVTILRDGKFIRTTDVADIAPPELIRLMVGRDLGQFERAGDLPDPGEEVLKVEGLSRAGVLHDVSLSVRAGQVVGIAGLVGAGRTELARAIMGLDRFDTGRITYLGRPVTISDPARAVRLGINLVPEDRRAEGLVSVLSVRDNAALSIVDRSSPLGWVKFRQMYRVVQRFVDQMAIKVGDVRNPVSGLSGGNQQKVVLAKCLATGCKLLILDEPSVGIDVGAKKEIYGIIEQLKRDGLAVIVISAELHELLTLSDIIYVMAAGRITAQLDPRTTTQEEILEVAIPPMTELTAAS